MPANVTSTGEVMSTSGKEQSEGISLQTLMLQMALFCAVFYLWSSPVLHPIKLMVVLFHEMSHGLMALLTGGEVISIVITSDEGGACETEGGVEAAIVSAGYLGSMFVGGMVLYLSRAKQAVPVAFGMLTLLMVASVATVLRDEYSRTFASCLAGGFIFLGFITPAGLGAFFLRAIGTFTCIYSLFDIYWDVLADHGEDFIAMNDATAFSQMTGADPHLVGMMWLVASIVFFVVVMKGALTTIESGGEASSSPKPAPAAA